MVLTGGSETAEPMFAVGRAYEWSTRRTPNLYRDARLSSSEAFSRLNCAALIGE